jgi:hypothetical protein
MSDTEGKFLSESKFKDLESNMGKRFDRLGHANLRKIRDRVEEPC